MIGVAQMIFEGGFEGGQSFLVKAQDEFFSGGSGEDFVKEDFEIRIGNSFQAKGWLAHFTDALANDSCVLRTQVGMKAEGHFEFVKRFAGDTRGENLVKAFETIMVALVAADAFFDG